MEREVTTFCISRGQGVDENTKREITIIISEFEEDTIILKAFAFKNKFKKQKKKPKKVAI